MAFTHTIPHRYFLSLLSLEGLDQLDRSIDRTPSYLPVICKKFMAKLFGVCRVHA